MSAGERRAARKAAAAAAAEAQREIDLEAIDALETTIGDSNVATIEIAHVPGLPVLLAVRCPRPVEIKRYRDEIKPRRDGSPGDALNGFGTHFSPVSSGRLR